ncbi:MAG: STAS-like domain-containing protein, partial [Vicinamibacterales bacterium]
RTRRERTLTMKEVFDKHSIEEYAFDKGAVRVALSNHGTEFVSRSEAKRLGAGLELYGEVELDFAGVKAVGQGFVDELFRVWVQDNPGTVFSYINATEEVAFMIERGQPRR